MGKGGAELSTLHTWLSILRTRGREIFCPIYRLSIRSPFSATYPLPTLHCTQHVHISSFFRLPWVGQLPSWLQILPCASSLQHLHPSSSVTTLPSNHLSRNLLRLLLSTEALPPTLFFGKTYMFIIYFWDISEKEEINTCAFGWPSQTGSPTCLVMGGGGGWAWDWVLFCNFTFLHFYNFTEQSAKSF